MQKQKHAIRNPAGSNGSIQCIVAASLRSLASRAAASYSRGFIVGLRSSVVEAGTSAVDRVSASPQKYVVRITVEWCGAVCCWGSKEVIGSRHVHFH